MRLFVKLFAVVFVFLFALVCFGDPSPIPLPSPGVVTDMGYDQALAALLVSVNGAKGMGTLGIIAVIVQGLMYVLRTPLGNFAGKFKLLAIYLLTVVLAVVALKLQGVSIGMAFINANVLAYLQVFAHQAMKQFMEPAADKPANPAA